MCKIIAFSIYAIVLMVSASFPAQAQYNSAYGSRAASLPRKPAPEGMLELPTNNVGRVLTSRMSGTNSARKMLMALRIGIADYFDSEPTLTAAFADRADRNLQAAFFAKLDGIPVRGLIAIQMQGSTGQATMLFDRTSLFPQTFENLSKAVNESAAQGNAPPAPVRLTPVPLLDGSGQIGLPPGWSVTGSYKGTVDAQGPQGEALALGGYAIVTNAQGGRMFPGIPVVDFNDSVRAALDYTNYQENQARMKGQPASSVTKIWDTRPIMLGDHRAAFIRFSANIAGRPYEGLGLYSIMPTDEMQAVLYMSVAIAPAPIFRQSFPGMWAAWQSWGVKDSVLQERLNSAISSMRETSDIITGSYQNRQDAYARVNEAWSNYMRDQSIWRDPTNPNTHYIVSNESLPPDGNMGRLESVPLSDLQP